MEWVNKSKQLFFQVKRRTLNWAERTRAEERDEWMVLQWPQPRLIYPGPAGGWPRLPRSKPEASSRLELTATNRPITVSWALPSSLMWLLEKHYETGASLWRPLVNLKDEIIPFSICLYPISYIYILSFFFFFFSIFILFLFLIFFPSFLPFYFYDMRQPAAAAMTILLNFLTWLLLLFFFPLSLF